MNSFSKKIQRFFVYFFTGASVLIVALGITRIKKDGTISGTATPNQNPSTNSGTTDTNTTTAVKGASVVANLNGNTYQTPWGDLAVTIQVKDGKVTAVTIPTLPDSPPSHQAEPYLVQQALSAGSANIQGVSGATITSNAFKASLESALAQAANIASSGSGPVVIDNTTPTTTDSAVAPSVPAPIVKAPVVTTPKISATKTTAGVNGKFTGNAYQTPWGNAVASIEVVNGKITNVTEPTVPNSPPSQYAAPYLIQQAIAAGSANIQGVSGATYASIAFKSSLESAISKANTTATAQGQASVAPASTSVTTQTTTSAPVTYPRRYHREDYDD